MDKRYVERRKQCSRHGAMFDDATAPFRNPKGVVSGIIGDTQIIGRGSKEPDRIGPSGAKLVNTAIVAIDRVVRLTISGAVPETGSSHGIEVAGAGVRSGQGVFGTHGGLALEESAKSAYAAGDSQSVFTC